jgi:DNA-binding CsgD family transcriptional regulator
MVIKNIHKYHGHQKIASKFDISNPNVQNHNLTPKDKVIEICELLQQGTLSMKEISIKVGVSNGTVTSIYHKKIYQHITKSYNFDKVKSSSNRHPKTPIDTVCRICEMLQEGKLTLKEIMLENKVSISVVKSIYSRSTYREVSAPYDFSNANVGERSKTSPDTVRKICELLQEGNMSRKEIAMVTNTSPSIIDHIYARRTYKSISREYNFK